ncbi:MAG: transglutaminaseTgpA domain-containing protein [Armatimonadota bacterium]|nr:transglutaminaseTgpA domain-containing protein [Armatimonadota bacterium]MDR7450400.1 transglutaminaseTgpA domain-containing protein [Armatimonadota bacterium]MDR7467017.1 transglutaminaseTgpA domain-containing protein [Armatimonadota bacterium]MDR7493441.1 transglutaminaseTgpA domain-containing protein [Armatimonadota bacterium]MDR7498706.1 transglutaminaseTgpA domain-containing protein [Armatimonadota bacterium]
MPRFLRPPPPPEDSVLVRTLVLLAVLIAVLAVGIFEEFTVRAGLSAAAITGGFATSHLLRRRRRLWLKAAITALVFVAARDFFSALIANPYDPRVALVNLFLWLQALHSFDLPARKDLKYSLASAVVLVAVAAVYARDAAFGVLLLPFAAASSAAMVSMTVPAGALHPGHLGRAAMALALAALVVSAVLFAAIPRGAGLRVRWLPVSPRLSLLARLQARIINPMYPDPGGAADPTRPPPVFNPQGYVGFSSAVDLRLRGVLDETVVMRVRSTRPALWRGLAFDEYTGVGWRMADQTVQEFISEDPRIVPRLTADEPWPADSEQVIQTFYVEAPQPNVFFAAYRPFEVYVPTGSVGVDRYAGLRSPAALEEGTIYSVISRVPRPAPGLLRRRRGDLPPAIRDRYLQLPAVPERVRALAAALTAAHDTVYDKTVAVNRYLVRHYTYNLQAPPLPHGADAVDYFLFESKQGACEAFASAMTVLLRAAGIPARLVTGYATGTYNLFTGYYEVRNADAHAWVEVYLPGAGWIEFEPTPGFPTPEEVSARTEGRWLARDAAVWAAAATQRLLAGLPGLALRLPPSGVLLGVLATLAVSLVLFRWRVGAIRPRDGVRAAYAAMLRALRRRGVVRHPHLTPRELLGAVPSGARDAAGEVTALFERVAYGGAAVTADDARRAAEALARTIAELQGRRR